MTNKLLVIIIMVIIQVSSSSLNHPSVFNSKSIEAAKKNKTYKIFFENEKNNYLECNLNDRNNCYMYAYLNETENKYDRFSSSNISIFSIIDIFIEGNIYKRRILIMYQYF